MSEREQMRDPEVARALDDIAVPGYEPGFWERLGARLEHERAPGGEADDAPRTVVVPSAPVPVGDLTPIELPAFVPLAPRREQRRSLAVLAVAAAAILAILVVRLGVDEPDAVRVAGGGDQAAGLAPDDGTTTPDASPERDGASREGDDDGPGTETLEAPSGGASEDRGLRSSPTTAVVGTAEGSDAEPLAALAAPKTAEDAFVAWATAIDEGEVQAAVRLTGPRTIAYYEALGSSAEEMVADSGEAWGVWADADGRHIQPVELGRVDGERAVGLVLDRPTADEEDADGRTYVGVPVVRGDEGWQVEPAAFDPARDGRIDVVSPAPGPTGLRDLPKGGTIRIAAQRTGEYYLNLDLSQSTRIPASDAVDGEITWNPGGQKSAILHLLVVAHIDDGQVVMLAQTFETAPA